MKTSLFVVPILILGQIVGAQPNDDFEDSIKMLGASGQTTGDNDQASLQLNGCGTVREMAHAGGPGGASVWWTWNAPADGEVIIDTFGSDFDTLLAVYTGGVLFTSSSCSASIGLTEVTSNDDDSATTFTSRVAFTAIAGTPYRVAVDGFGGAEGDIVLTWEMVQGVPLPDPPSWPQGRFALAIVIDQPAVAPDGSPVEYVYQWSSDGGDRATHGPTYSRADVLVETVLVDPGETWTIAVTPFARGVGGPIFWAQAKVGDMSNGVVEWTFYP